MKNLKNIITIVAALVLLSSCGNTKQDRALSGAGIGAGAGAVGGVLLGVNPITSAIVGGAVGAATGGLTDKDDVDLGKPAWK